MSSARRARPRLLALGALLGAGLLVAGISAFAASAGLSDAPATVGVAAPTEPGGLVPDGAGTVPATVAADPTTSPSTATTAAAYPSSSASSVATVVTAATVPPVVFTGAFASFDERLRSALIGHGALAVSVAIAQNGKIVHANAYGVANPLTGEPATPAHRFRIASNSKLLTATAIMELVEAGRLRLDEPVLARLAKQLGVTPTDPGIPAVTLRQLLSHTSGFPEYERTFFGGTAASCTEAAARGLGGPLLGPPGTIYRYSNMNFCLLGLLIEQVTGQHYEQAIDQRVLAPLGIDDMHMTGTAEVRPGDVAHPITPGRKYMEALGAAGAWVGTPTDLVHIIDALDPDRPGPHPLSAATVAQMRAPQPGIVYSPGQWYGLGLRVWADGTWGHTGTVENARSMVLHRPDGITWAVTVSGNAPSNTDRIRHYVDQAFATIGVAPPPITNPPPPAPAAPAATAAATTTTTAA
jgi:D-alanyl-D-alanine carboxypeptidase